MAYDATKMKDWQISEAAEDNMPMPEEWKEKLGLEKDEMLAMGRLGKLDFLKIMNRLNDKPDGKYIARDFAWATSIRSVDSSMKNSRQSGPVIKPQKRH